MIVYVEATEPHVCRSHLDGQVQADQVEQVVGPRSRREDHLARVVRVPLRHHCHRLLGRHDVRHRLAVIDDAAEVQNEVLVTIVHIAAARSLILAQTKGTTHTLHIGIRQ